MGTIRQLLVRMGRGSRCETHPYFSALRLYSGFGFAYALRFSLGLRIAAEHSFTALSSAIHGTGISSYRVLHLEFRCLFYSVTYFHFAALISIRNGLAGIID